MTENIRTIPNTTIDITTKNEMITIIPHIIRNISVMTFKPFCVEVTWVEFAPFRNDMFEIELEKE